MKNSCGKMMIDNSDLLDQFLSVVGIMFLVTAQCRSSSRDISENGVGAIDCFRWHQMPDMDGTALRTADLRQIPCPLPSRLCMLTCPVEKRSIDRAFAAGATDFITKLQTVRAGKPHRRNRASGAQQTEHVSTHPKTGRRRNGSGSGQRPVPLEASAMQSTMPQWENYVASCRAQFGFSGSWVFAFYSWRKPESLQRQPERAGL